MKIFIASDHAGFELKEYLKTFLEQKGFGVKDFGAFAKDNEDDYPDFISKAAKEVSENPENVRAIVLGGSGQGEAIMANRFSNVRAVVYVGEPKENEDALDMIKLTREHNNSNVLSLGARFLTNSVAETAVKKWLETDFPAEDRHFRRIEKIESLSQKYEQ